jgi:hypothetical protein
MKREFSQFKFAIAFFAMVVASYSMAPVKFACGDTLVVKKGGEEVSLVGEFLFEARDKSILFESTDGQLHVFESKEIVDLKKDIEITVPMNHEELGKSLLEELPNGFKLLQTDSYVIAYQTGPGFAKWIADLYEKRLVSKFEDFAKRKLKSRLSDPKFPMAVVVFGSKPEYIRYATREFGSDPGAIIAHYSQMTNRVAMYDLTFTFGPGPNGKPQAIEKVLQQPAAIPMVTTIIHEATHQLMFNRGLQVRMADAPLWLNEGLANWFEAPNVKNRHGWTGPGLVNNFRLLKFREYLARRPNDSLERLISDDDRFAGDGAFDAYAESWALVHFLLKHRRDEFCDYLKVVSKKRPGIKVDAKTRLQEFVEHFGDQKGELKKLDKAFLKYVKALKLR